MIGVFKVLIVATCLLACNALSLRQGDDFHLIPKDMCKKTINSRIINGKHAPLGAFPYQASLQWYNRHFCGGSIINERWILTAAHCLKQMKDNEILVVVGANKLYAGGQAYQSVKVIPHASFNFESTLNDVGLVMVNETIKFNKYVQPIDLPTEDMDKHNEPALISGWGLDENYNTPTDLQYMPTCLQNQRTCKAKIPYLSEHHICTFTHRGQGACNGDSGSPLVQNGIQLGIASFVVETCAGGHPDVFARVWTFIDWIKEHAIVV